MRIISWTNSHFLQAKSHKLKVSRGFTPHQFCKMFYFYPFKNKFVNRVDYNQSNNTGIGAGFTLIELIIVLGILIIVSVLSIPFIQTFQTSSNLVTHTHTICQTLRRAQQQAIAGLNNSSWGVYFDNGGNFFVLFKGEDYATRDVDYDQENEYPQIFDINSDFGNQIYFSAYSGQPSTFGILMIASPNNESKTITISSVGLIQIDE